MDHKKSVEESSGRGSIGIGKEFMGSFHAERRSKLNLPDNFQETTNECSI
jgi:hypothetical protein